MSVSSLSQYQKSSPFNIVCFAAKKRKSNSRYLMANQRGFVELEVFLWLLILLSAFATFQKISQHYDQELVLIIENFQNKWNSL